MLRPPLREICAAATARLRQLDAAVMPNACVFCGARRDLQSVPVCPGCYADLPRTSGGRRIRGLLVHAPLHYEFPVDAAIKALKFSRKLWYAPALSALMAEELDELPPDIDGALPVPLHWRRQFLRGFNQAEVLFRPMRRQLQLAPVCDVRRLRNTATQSGLDARARWRNLRGAFRVHGTPGARHVLLIDDVITTGATCAALARALYRAGVEEVSVLAAACASMK